MAISQPTKPIFNKGADKPPFKASESTTEEEKRTIQAAVTSPANHDGWGPIDTAPTDPAARFLVRATVNGKPIGGTEMLVRYRASRKMVGRKWQSALTIIDDRLGTKLGFRPTEWCLAPASRLNDSTWDDAIKKANDARARDGE